MILTAKVGRNKDQFPDILTLYAKKGQRIADVTYGNGNFWSNVNKEDYELITTDLATGVDFRELPYLDQTIDMVVLDPPYIHNSSNTIHKNLSAVYANNSSPDMKTMKSILQLYADGMKEAHRVLRDKGTLVVKCQDIIESGKQVWSHIEIFNSAYALGFTAEDLLVMVQTGTPIQRWPHQLHFRRNHSYWWIFKKVK